MLTRCQYTSCAQEVHEGVIATLAEASDKTRGAFLDLAFLRKQRQRGGGASSRSWYVTIDHWLTGTVAATEAAEAFGGEEVSSGRGAVSWAAPVGRNVHLKRACEDASMPDTYFSLTHSASASQHASQAVR